MSAELVGVDVGGTFTDIVAIEDGRIVATKVPTDTAATDASVLEGARRVGVEKAKVFNLATTAGLNARWKAERSKPAGSRQISGTMAASAALHGARNAKWPAFGTT